MPDYLIDIITAVLAGGALVFSYISFRKSNRMTMRLSKSATYSDIMSRLFELNKLEIEKPALFEALYNDFKLELVKKGGGKDGLGHYLFMLFNLYEEVFNQREDFDLLDDKQFRQWKSRIRNDFKHRKFLPGYWAYVKQESEIIYSEDFKEFIDRVIA